jgi:hypothetical protein
MIVASKFREQQRVRAMNLKLYLIVKSFKLSAL